MPDLPKPIAAYFTAPANADLAALAAIFARDAAVQDEAREHHGLEAIRAWRMETMQRTPFTARPLSIADRDGDVVVPTLVSGAFPGSPVTLDHRFALRDGLIAALKIA